MKHKYTVEELSKAVTDSTSIRQVLLKLGIAAYGGNYQTINNRLISHNIDTSHFTGQGWSKNQTVGPKVGIDRYLSNELPIQSDRLRKRLLSSKVFQPICSRCTLSEWNNKPIPLELDHISGNNQDNRLDNLQLLCPNCHAQTPTYRGKNKRSEI